MLERHQNSPPSLILLSYTALVLFFYPHPWFEQQGKSPTATKRRGGGRGQTNKPPGTLQYPLIFWNLKTSLKWWLLLLLRDLGGSRKFCERDWLIIIIKKKYWNILVCLLRTTAYEELIFLPPFFFSIQNSSELKNSPLLKTRASFFFFPSLLYRFPLSYFFCHLFFVGFFFSALGYF